MVILVGRMLLVSGMAVTRLEPRDQMISVGS